MSRPAGVSPFLVALECTECGLAVEPDRAHGLCAACAIHPEMLAVIKKAWGY